MNNRKFRVLSWVIVAAIMMTVLAQGYWNWRNFEENKRFLISEVQVALDNAVEQYYAQLAKVHFIQMDDTEFINQQLDDTFPEIITTESSLTKTYRCNTGNKEVQKIQWNIDSLVNTPHPNMLVVSKMSSADTVLGTAKRFIKLASKLAMSLEADSLDKKRLDSLMTSELNRKGIDEDFSIDENAHANPSFQEVVIQANSTYLSSGTELYLTIQPSLTTVLKKGISGVVVSLLTALVIIMVLLYLYRFIQHQKSLDMMKNDLISNITHEFKTPIATVSTALEAIEKFNTEKDFAKTSKYLKLSNEQLQKLDGMVEKLLDTATLADDQLMLNKKKIDLDQLIAELLARYNTLETKTMSWQGESDIWIYADQFHLEHAISNLIDNAIKYGGNKVLVHLSQQNNLIELKVTDNGTGIAAKEQTKIFEKFYRISSGNVHDVKGYGIGLYYARTIVEKHNGKLDLTSKAGNTSFKITFAT